MSPQILALFCLLLGGVLCQDRYPVGEAPYPAMFWKTTSFGTRVANDSLLNPFNLLQFLPSGQKTTKLFTFPNQTISKIEVTPIIPNDSVTLGSGGPGTSAVSLVFKTADFFLGNTLFILQVFGE